MKSIYVLIIITFVKCNNPVSEKGGYYPHKINDTFFYVGNMKFKCIAKEIDTSYYDTMYVTRLRSDSIAFIYHKIDFLGLYDSLKMRESIEPFSIKDEFSVNINDKYLSYSICYSFKNSDSLLYKEEEKQSLHNAPDATKFLSIEKIYSFNGKKVIK